MRRFLFAIWLACVANAAGAQSGLAGLTQQATAFLPVDEAYQLEIELSDPTSLRLYWQITDGYYLYQHRFKVEVADADGAVAHEISFPPALEKTDEFFGEVQVYYGSADLRVDLARPLGDARLAVTSQGCADAGLCYPPNTQVFGIDAGSGAISDGEPALATTPGNTGDQDPGAGTEPADVAGLGALLGAMGFAFLGGLILNAMPCVLPILSLKALSFATGDPSQHHRHAWWYLAGVVASFVAVAGVLIFLQRAGQFIGWGFQLQSPGFVIALAYLFVAMGLSLSGVVAFGGGLMNVGNTLAGQGGNRGSFFTGVLAVVVASPCTAPFMGSALGFALGQPPLLAMTVFVALGAGMAAPMVLLSYSQWARDALPKPGPWMETLKELLAFPLYATAVWLLWVAGKQTGVDTMASALGGLVMLSLGLYLYRGSRLRRSFALLSLVCAALLATQIETRERTVGEAPRAEGTVAWSPEALAGLRREGVPVFVDVTADWCITCLANEQAVLFTEDTRRAFEDSGVVYMIADWTNYDESIGAFVRSHNRNGIPLYVMYPGDPASDPFLLPQLLTRSIMEEALSRVSVQ